MTPVEPCRKYPGKRQIGEVRKAYAVAREESRGTGRPTIAYYCASYRGGCGGYHLIVSVPPL